MLTLMVSFRETPTLEPNPMDALNYLRNLTFAHLHFSLDKVMFRTKTTSLPKSYTVSPMSMRAPRLARLASARIGSRISLPTSIGVSRSSILDKVQIRPNGSPGIRLLASLAADPVKPSSAQLNGSKSITHGNIASNDLRLHVEAVDGLLRSGIGGSDVWTERLQQVKDDLKVQRPRRIAGTISSVEDADR
jgi:hypothetical protein